MCTCGIVCPALGPSWIAYVSDVAPWCFSSADPTFFASVHTSTSSSSVRLSNRLMIRRVTTRTCPGTTGLRLTMPYESGVSANTCDRGMSSGPKL